jgi:hypothetical protein
MAKRDSVYGQSADKMTDANIDDVSYNNVKLQLLIDIDLTLIGVSGKQYRWSHAGDIVDVDKTDAEIFLKKRYGERFCCGTHNQLFDIVE